MHEHRFLNVQKAHVQRESHRPGDWAEEIVEKYTDKLFRAALAILGGKAEAEDIVQDVFVKLIEKPQKFESSKHESAWLLRVTVNLCKDRIRSHWWKKTISLFDTYPGRMGERQNPKDFTTSPAQDEHDRDLMQTVLSLPSKYRAVIHLFYYEGYSTKEIADITGQKESTIRQQLTRARRMLKHFLEGEPI